MSKKRILCVVGYAATAVLVCWNLARQPRIIDIHRDGNIVAVIAEQLHYFDRTKINWWKENEHRIHARLNLSEADASRLSFYVISFNEGYEQPDDSDQLCFDDMTSPARCLQKNYLLVVKHSSREPVEYCGDEHCYVDATDGSLVRIR
ncbi:DUF943 family protein [Siccibacter colletis]|uniref:DUF943 family protein n=1 Tax=Siccibacter colletis TaxID=1505757 RepID=A0ABY6JCD1_9ENTR|nr:DUF943 family protein [Siccibacter colletis]UYU30249.1 DUF943 family protein [Siccibacter colletis]